jgi:uncharacterized surface anchored protein
VTFSIDDEDDVLDCTYSNVARGTVVIEKITQGGSGTFGFGSNPDLPSPADASGDFDLTTTAAGTAGKDSKTFSNLVAGSTVVVTEDDPTPGWDLTGLSCTTGGTENLANRTATITVPAGGTVTCTYTNTKRGTIVIEKQTIPDGDPGTFDFTGEITATLGDGGTADKVVVPGTYVVNETAKDGWNLTDLSCDDDDSVGSVGQSKATFNVQPGETVTCTFENTKLSRIDVKKVDDDDPANPLQGAVFTLYHDNATVGEFDGADTAVQVGGQDLTCTTGANGECSFGDLMPGDYVVVETTTPEGYKTADPQFITVAAGDLDADIELTFTDDRYFKVIVLVCEKGGDDTLYPSAVSFDGEALPGSPNTPGSLDLPAGIDESDLCGLSGTYVHDDVLKGSHSASVNIPQ